MNQENNKNTLSQGEFSKEKLLEKLQLNLEKHNKFHEDAVESYWIVAENKINELESNYFKGYRKLKKLAIGELNEQKENIKNKNGESVNLNLPTYVSYEKLQMPPFPKSHSEEYERTIEWLNLVAGDTIQLSNKEFDQYVMDNWEFKNEMRSFTTGFFNMCDYSGYASPALASGYLPISAHTGKGGYLY